MRFGVNAKSRNHALFAFATLRLKPGKQIMIYRHSNDCLSFRHSPGSSCEEILVQRRDFGSINGFVRQ